FGQRALIVRTYVLNCVEIPADIENRDVVFLYFRDDAVSGGQLVRSGDGNVFLGGVRHQKSTFASLPGVVNPACCARNLRSAALTVFRAKVAHLGRLITISRPNSSTNSS